MRSSRRAFFDSFGYVLGRRLCLLCTLINTIVLVLYVSYWLPSMESHAVRRQRAYEPAPLLLSLPSSSEGGGGDDSAAARAARGGGVGEFPSSSRLRRAAVDAYHSQHDSSSGRGVALSLASSSSSSALHGMPQHNDDADRYVIHYEGDGHLHHDKTLEHHDDATRHHSPPRYRRRTIPFLSHVASMLHYERFKLSNPIQRWIDECRLAFLPSAASSSSNEDEEEHHSSDNGRHRHPLGGVGPGTYVNDDNDDAEDDDGEEEEAQSRRFLSAAAAKDSGGGSSDRIQHSSNTKKMKPLTAEEECSPATAQHALRKTSGHRVLIPPDLLLDFTLNATIPLLYEYRDNNDVLIAVSDGHVHNDDEIDFHERHHTHHHSKNVSSSSATSLSSTTSSSSSSWVEGKDFKVGRRYFTTAMLRKAYADQIRLMDSARDYHGDVSILKRRRRQGGGDDDGEDAAAVEDSSSSSSLATISANPFASYIHLFEAIRRYSPIAIEGAGAGASFVVVKKTKAKKALAKTEAKKGEEGDKGSSAKVSVRYSSEMDGQQQRTVAVFGSMETPLLEVALLTLGKAEVVHSIDVRPIVSADKRIIGHDAFRYWRRVEERRELLKRGIAERKRRGRRGMGRGGDSKKRFMRGEESPAAMVSGGSSDAAEVRLSPVVAGESRRVIRGKHQRGKSREIEEKTDETSRVGVKAVLPVAPPHTNASSSAASIYELAQSPPVVPTRFDLILAVGSIEHSGLGRYGDALDPFGDIKALSVDVWSLLKVGGIAIVSVPVGNDCLVFNQFRVYGRRRLPLLLHGWEIVSVHGLDDRTAEQLFYKSRDVVAGGGRDGITHAKSLFRRMWEGLLAKLGFDLDSVVADEIPTATNPFTTTASSSLKQRVISRWEDGQCDGTQYNSPIFVLKKAIKGTVQQPLPHPSFEKEKVDDEEYNANDYHSPASFPSGFEQETDDLLLDMYAKPFTPLQTLKEYKKVRGMLGPFPLFHKPR